MKILSSAVLTFAVILACNVSSRAQQKKAAEVTKPAQIVRTVVKHDRRRFLHGGTLTLEGAPAGSISIESWPNSEVDVTAEIELRADSEADLDRLAAVNTIVLDDDANHIRIVTTGTHDKAFMKQVKKFPKALLGLPWKIAYRIRVPSTTDLEINAGRGPISVTDVEGDIQLSAAESETTLKLSGGNLNAVVGIGKVNLIIPVKSWRRGGVIIRVAAGEVAMELPLGFAGDFDAQILRTGQIIDSYGGLEAREKPGITPQKMKARAGAGGTWVQLTVGDGTITIKKREQ
ncbi:MAG TPA: hypothetical protein VJU86_02725 [Pyrinomonadaceae bacterium]|nr:hypothetical protein [Pyrinomonadaceae bacterium]